MGSFNNTGISGLWIGGKSVRRASLGGKVFFEKHDYDFSLTSDKSILSHADNESATLTATLTDYDEPVSGETVIFTADTPFKTNVINDTGTYDFGDYISVDISNFKNIDAMYNLSQGKLEIGNSNAYLRLWGLNGSNVPHNFIWLEHYVNGSRIDQALIVVNHPLIFRNGILYYYGSVDNSHDNLQDSTLDVSDVDLNEWAFSGKVIGVDVTVDEYWWASDVTDSNGEATVGYVSKGTGDLNIKCEVVDRMLVSETYSLEDCLRYNSLTSNDGLFSSSGGVSASYSTNGLTVLGTRTSDSYYLSTFNFPSSDFSIEYTLEGYVFNQHNCASDIIMYGLFIEPKINGFDFRTSSTMLLDSSTVLSQGDVIKFEITGNTVKLYVNDTYYATGNKFNTNCGLKTYNQRSITVKDMKIKPL